MGTGTDKGPRRCLEVGEDILRHPHVESPVEEGGGDMSKMVQLGPGDIEACQVLLVIEFEDGTRSFCGHDGEERGWASSASSWRCLYNRAAVLTIAFSLHPHPSLSPGDKQALPLQLLFFPLQDRT